MKFPLPPYNIFITYPFIQGVTDIYFDDPSEFKENVFNYTILGTNIYRAFDNPDGDYIKLNDTPIGTQIYRDFPKTTLVSNYKVQKSDLVGENPSVILLHNYLCNANGANATLRDIQLTIDSIDIPIVEVNAVPGLIKIDPYTRPRIFGVNILPNIYDFLDHDVRVTYRYADPNNINNYLYPKIYYKVSTVGVDKTTSLTVETPLSYCKPFTAINQESEPYWYRTIEQRMRWLLSVGGERVYLFLRKKNGPKCSCWDFVNGQADSNCPMCFGSGIYDTITQIGGYEGPINILVSSFEKTETNTFDDNGANREVAVSGQWAPPSPIISNYDLLARQNGEVYSISNWKGDYFRGKLLLAQHFDFELVNTHDPLYQMVKSRLYNASVVAPTFDDIYGTSIPGQNSLTGLPVTTQMPQSPELNRLRWAKQRRGISSSDDNINNPINLIPDEDKDNHHH